MTAEAATHRPGPWPLAGKRVLVCGKGGSGKTSIVALLAQALAGRGYEVLALDGDASNPGGLAPLLLEHTRGARPLIEFFGGRARVECPIEDPSPLTRIDDSRTLRDEPIRLDELPAEYVLREGRLTLLQVGKITRALEGCEGPMSKVTRDFHTSGDHVTLIDVEAGIEHFGRGVEASVDIVVVVVDPTFESLDIASRIAGLCRELGVEKLGAILNRVRPSLRDAMRRRLQERNIPVLGGLAWESALEEATFEGRRLPLEPVADEVGAIVSALESVARTEPRLEATGNAAKQEVRL